MGLFGSLFTGVSGLFAQSQNTAIISNNIANINTTGYKRSEASFFSLVTTEGASSVFSPGTVSVNRIQRVDQQGAIQQTASSTDASISGNGFFPVQRSGDFGQETLYTRNGTFSEDSQGLLRNASGFILQAWPIDAEGNLPANQGDLISLVPANVAFLGGLTRPTSSAELSINLDANQEPINGQLLSPPQALPVGDQPAHFTRGLTVFDALGSEQNLSLEYRKIVGPSSNFTSNSSITAQSPNDVIAGGGGASGRFPGINVGDALDITIGGTTETFEFVDTAGTGVIAGANEIVTVQDYIDALESFGTGAELSATLTSGGDIRTQAIDPSVTITVADNVGTPATGTNALAIVPDPKSGTLTFTPDFDITTNLPAGVYPSQGTEFPQVANTTSANPDGWWELTVIHPDGSTLSQGLVNFDGNGSLNAGPDSEGNIDIELQGIDFGNGSALQDLSIDIESFSQFAGNFDVIFSDQNGAELGLRTGVEITRDGRVVARFSNGASADLYQIPIVTFANPNGLTEVSGTAYSESDESGEENLREAGSGGAGFVEPSTLEASNVDLADEFARLIVSQRAFGASTRLISTVDEMTEDLLRLR